MKIELSRGPDPEVLLARHDVVFGAPVADPTYGLPVGNGSLGALLWPDGDTLRVRVNHTDFIDDLAAAQSADPDFCAAADEANTICRSGAEFSLRFRCPIFEGLYQRCYEGRLDLYGARALIRAETPFGECRIRAYCSERYGVFVLEAETETEDALPLSGTLGRWGSRSFMYWYSNLRPGPETGLGGTSSAAGEDGVFSVSQEMHGLCFSVAAKAVGEAPSVCRTAGSHAAEIEFPARKTHRLTLLFSAGTGKTAREAEEKARGTLEAAAEAGIGAIETDHRAAWREFWSRSWVVLPEDQDFIENLWYLDLYYANSEMKGEYPPHFCSGIWGFYHDFVPWNCYFHYNTQHALYPLDPAGHPELTDTYHRFRRGQLPYAETAARLLWGKRGSFYGDVCDMKGRMARNVKHNCTCGAQIAMEMLRHYRYTGDEEFLRGTALPLLKSAGEFYLDMLEKGEDGCWHIRGTQGYEGSPLFEDSITDLSMIRALFSALPELLSEEEGAPYRERLEKLAPFETADFLEGELDETGAFARGVGKGRKPLAPKVLSVGRDEKGECVRRTFADPANDWYGFPDTEMSPLYPAGIVGLAERDSELFLMIRNSVMMHHRTKIPDPVPPGKGLDTETESCMGWCMMPLYLARLGEAGLLAEELDETVSGWIAFPQGFGIYTPADRTDGNLTNRFRQYTVRHPLTGEETKVPAWPFRHFDYETLPIAAAAVNEMFLQSYDGILRFFPAARKETSFAFRLYAEGGFAAEAVYDRGDYAAKIESLRGGKLRVAFEAEPPDRIEKNGEAADPAEQNGVYETETTPGDVFRFVRGAAPVLEREYAPNTGVKILGNAKLGTEKEFDSI